MRFSSDQPKIIVVGSSSIDLVLNVPKYPAQNETILATKVESFFGGKGANQAVGTSRLGASVYFVGAVGMDPFGQQIMRNLKDEGVNVGYTHESLDYPSGTAYVTAAENRNTIIVVPSANAAAFIVNLSFFTGIGLLFALGALILEKDNKFVRFYGKQTLALNVIVFLSFLLNLVVVIGSLVWVVLILAITILQVYATVKTYFGETFEIPFINKIMDFFFFD